MDDSPQHREKNRAILEEVGNSLIKIRILESDAIKRNDSVRSF